MRAANFPRSGRCDLVWKRNISARSHGVLEMPRRNRGFQLKLNCWIVPKEHNSFHFAPKFAGHFFFERIEADVRLFEGRLAGTSGS
jgi:hypothetical protein